MAAGDLKEQEVIPIDFLSNRVKNVRQGAIRAMFEKANRMTGVISLGIGEPDMPTPAAICRAGQDALNKGITHYAPNAGTLELRKAVASKTNIKDLDYDPLNEILIANGGTGAIAMTFLTIIDPGDEILLQDPQWLNYEAQIKLCGGTPVRIPTQFEENFEINPDVMEGLITPKTKAVIINSPNNPTGAVISRSTMEKIAEIVRKHNILLITDEVYNTLLFDGEQAFTVASLPGMKERTIVINSFSKSYAMTGWRVGWAAGPADIISKMVPCMEYLNACVNTPGQYAACYALDHPELSAELAGVFARRRELLTSCLSEIKGFKLNKFTGAFYAFPNIKEYRLSSEEFCDRLLMEGKVVCIPGSAFGDSGEGHIRICYSNSEQNIIEAVKRIKTFCESI